jgi:hypothetical protein
VVNYKGFLKKILWFTEKNIKVLSDKALSTILSLEIISIWAMPEQLQIEVLVRLLREADFRDEDIIDCLSSIIKTQMMMGGSLENKLEFHKSQAEKKILCQLK